jgi:hypothetical protein
MSGIKRFFLAFFIAICSLILIFALLLKVIFPPRMLRNFVQWRISSFTGGRTEIKSVSLDLRGIVLEDIKVFFAGNLEITAKKIIISPNLFPFPRKQIAINRIKIINPTVKFKNGVKSFKINRKLFITDHTIVLSRFIIEDGIVEFPKLTISKIAFDINNVSSGNFFPVELFFSINDTKINVKSECNLKTKEFLIKEAFLKENKAILFLNGEIKEFYSPDDMNFKLEVKGNGLLFNKVLLSNLYKRNVTVFTRENINLKIIGNLKDFQIKNKS